MLMSKVVRVESLVLLCSCCCSCLGLQEVSDLLLMRGEGVIDNIVHFRIQIFFLLFLLSIYLFFNQIAYKLGLLYSEMIFVNGYVHCDPHPGNIFVRRDPSNGVEIVFLDHGLYQVWEVLSQVYQGLHSWWTTTDIMGFLIIFFRFTCSEICLISIIESLLFIAVM